MSQVVVHRQVLRYLERLSRPDQERVRVALVSLADDPAGYPGVVRMAGEWVGYRRIRIGELRVIFWYDERDDLVCVDHIGARGDVYK